MEIFGLLSEFFVSGIPKFWVIVGKLDFGEVTCDTVTPVNDGAEVTPV